MVEKDRCTDLPDKVMRALLKQYFFPGPQVDMKIRAGVDPRQTDTGVGARCLPGKWGAVIRGKILFLEMSNDKLLRKNFRNCNTAPFVDLSDFQKIKFFKDTDCIISSSILKNIFFQLVTAFKIRYQNFKCSMKLSFTY